MRELEQVLGIQVILGVFVGSEWDKIRKVKREADLPFWYPTDCLFP